MSFLLQNVLTESIQRLPSFARDAFFFVTLGGHVPGGLFALITGPSFKTVLCTDAPVLPLGIFELAAENPTTAWVLVIQAIVHVVDESVVLDGISGSPSLQDRVVGFDTEFAQRILTVVTDPSEVIGLTTQPIFQHTGGEFFQGLVCKCS